MSSEVDTKRTRRPRDMAISLIVLLIPVALVILAYRTLYQGDQVVAVDPAEAIGSAQRSGLTDLPPVQAPEGWTVVSAQFKDQTLRIGYVDKQLRGVQLIQGRGQVPAPQAGEKAFSGSRNGVTVTVITKDADLTPLLQTLPIPLAPSPG